MKARIKYRNKKEKREKYGGEKIMNIKSLKRKEVKKINRIPY